MFYLVQKKYVVKFRQVLISPDWYIYFYRSLSWVNLSLQRIDCFPCGLLVLLQLTRLCLLIIVCLAWLIYQVSCSFVWLELVSHRSFMPKLLTCNGQKGWPYIQRLLVDLFQFMEPFLRNAELTEPVWLVSSTFKDFLFLFAFRK